MNGKEFIYTNFPYNPEVRKTTHRVEDNKKSFALRNKEEFY